jgi:hypothetical protein
VNRTTARTARRPRRCGAHGERISVGDRYLEHVASPNHSDLSNPTWWRDAECAGCARRYGRGHLLSITSNAEGA